MDRYKKVNLERKGNKYGRARISYLQQMESFREARASKRCERDLQVRIKEMHTHMRETERKEEEEEIKQREEALRKWEEELRIHEE
jgi:hypothetical protein